MNQDPLSHGLWEASAPPAPEAPALQGHATADVAIVGAGAMGAAYASMRVMLAPAVAGAISPSTRQAPAVSTSLGRKRAL